MTECSLELGGWNLYLPLQAREGKGPLDVEQLPERLHNLSVAVFDETMDKKTLRPLSKVDMDNLFDSVAAKGIDTSKTSCNNCFLNTAKDYS